MGKLLMEKEVYEVVGAAMAVHTELGAGFLEAVYQEAMEIELEERGIEHQAQAPLRINYKGRQLKKEYIADFIIVGPVLVEIKALDELTGTDEAQLLNYLKATGIRVGVLINFGRHSGLEWKRFIN